MLNLEEKRILLTGSTGFFGSHILAELQLRGCHDIVTPRHADYDLRYSEDVECMYSELRPQVVIHCAAHCGGIGLNKEKPADLFFDNITMGVFMMDAARCHDVEKFVQLGTVCEYPKFTPVPFSEDNLWNGYPEETNAPYGIAKKALLVMGQAYRQQYGFNAIHLLPVNLYGPRDNFDPKSSHVIPALIRKFEEAKASGQPSVSIWGSGNAYREFLYVEDAAKAIVLATERYDEGEPVNIGTGCTVAISNLAEIIADKVGFKGIINFDTSMPDGQPERCLNTGRATQKFGFTATTSLSKGLDKTIKWYEEVIMKKSSTWFGHD